MDPKPLPPFPQRAAKWLRRRTPLLLALAMLLAYLYAKPALQILTAWVYDAPPISADQENLSPAQVAAAQAAGGFKQFGTITSVLLAGIGLFSVALALVWFVMKRITPALPVWAKASFTEEFNQLPVECRFKEYARVWFGLLALFAFCLLVAALSQ